jgi:hypothetical protein
MGNPLSFATCGVAAYEDEPKSSSAQFDTTLGVLSKNLVDNKAWRKKELL